jgi:hypothetical protein
VEKRMQSKTLQKSSPATAIKQPKTAGLPPLGLVIGGGGTNR